MLFFFSKWQTRPTFQAKKCRKASIPRLCPPGSRAGRLNAKIAEWQKSVAGEATKTPLQVVALLAANPFITAKGIAEKLGVAFTTAQRAIARLERLGIVQQTGIEKRGRVYCAKAFLDILEEPAQS